MVVSISPRAVFRFIFGAIAVLVTVHAAFLLIKYGYGHDYVFGLIPLFDLDGEQNIPSLFSALDLVLASMLLLLLYRNARMTLRIDSGYWLALAIIFAFLAIDEFCGLHERLIIPVRQALHTAGALLNAWVIPYGLLMLGFGVTYLRFWWRLPSRNRAQFAIAGMIYLGGALGMEMVGGKIYSIYGPGLLYDIEVMIEETMEMSGVALFVFALLELLRDRAISILFSPHSVDDQRDELLSDVLENSHRDVA